MRTKRRFVIGDIHGACRALLQCFERSGFNRGKDILVCLGDACDSWPEVDKTFDELLKVKNLIYLLGNHDQWTLEWFRNGSVPHIWLIQGGEATRKSYPDYIPDPHINLLSEAGMYYETDRKLFVHGGIEPGLPLDKQRSHTFIWDRSLVHTAIRMQHSGIERSITGYDEVYVGHTPTINYGHLDPIKACEVYMMDTGAGWPGGVLTMMDIDSKEVFQSDIVSNLYPGERGR